MVIKSNDTAAVRSKSLAKSYGKEEVFYTLILSDLDHISTSKQDNAAVSVGEYVQWMVVNIPGQGQVSEGSTLLEYIGPAPEHGSGLHRMVFSLYKQKGLMAKPALDDAKKYYAVRTVPSYPWIKEQGS